MKPKFHIKKLDERAIALMADNMREMDLLELRSMIPNRSTIDALRYCEKVSFEAWSGWIDDELLCIYGGTRTTAMTSVSGCWCIFTNRVQTKSGAYAALKIVPSVLHELFAGYKRIYNYVYVGNTTTIRWLKRMGFVFLSNTITLNGHDFVEFEKRNL